MKKIIFVCTGNTCRSPMAEGLFKKEIAKNNIDIEVGSRGLYANGFRANDKAVMTMIDYDISIDHHRSTQFDISEIDADTLILTMTREHKAYIDTRYPEIIDRVYVLNEYVGLDGDIADPFSGSIEHYKGCATQIYEAINKLIDRF